jgi:hypothetical protein
MGGPLYILLVHQNPGVGVNISEFLLRNPEDKKFDVSKSPSVPYGLNIIYGLSNTLSDHTIKIMLAAMEFTVLLRLQAFTSSMI